MRLRPALALVPLAAALGTGVAPRTTAAQMTPLADNRQTWAYASFLGNTEQDTESPVTPFAYFFSALDVIAYNPDPEGGGLANASAFQVSQFLPSAITLSGGTQGSYQVYQGAYSAHSFAEFRFRLDACAEYMLDAWLDYGTFSDPGAGYVRLTGPTSQTVYQQLVNTTGELHLTGRIAPGEYLLEARSGFGVGGVIESVQGPTFDVIWLVLPCGSPLIAQHPMDLTVPSGSTATFSVVTTGAMGTAGATGVAGAGTLTFQWRRNLVPLIDSGHIGGSTTPILSIFNATDTDSGYYDVVVSDGSVEEPSRLARLQIGTTAGIGAPGTSRGGFTLLAAGPNPFTTGTAFRYAATRPTRATIAIYDVTGARVRTLADGVIEGTGTLAWDGRSSAGDRLPAGVYFLRADTGVSRESCRVVLLQ